MAVRRDNEATSAWLERIIGEGATDAQINGVRQILAGEQGISIISFHLAHLMIFLCQFITANAGNAGELNFFFVF